MARLAERLRSFRGLSSSARQAGLVDALRFAERDELGLLIEELGDSPTTAGYEILLERYYQIEKGARLEILDGGLKLSAALVRALHSSDEQLRRTALQLIEMRGDRRCIGGLGAIFSVENESSANLGLAARLVRGFAQSLTESVIPNPAERLAFEQLDKVVVSGLNSYPQHREAEVLLAAALLMPMAGVGLRGFLEDRDHPAHFALRGVLKKFDDAFIAESALAWMNLDQLAPQMGDRLAGLARTARLGQVLETVHLVHLPRVKARLGRMNGRYAASLPLGEATRIFDAETQARLVGWLAVVPMPLPTRIAYLGEGLCFKSGAGRLAALRELMSLEAGEADAMAESFCFDEEEVIARIAVRHCLRVYGRKTGQGMAGSELFGRLMTSPHASVRKMMSKMVRIEDFAAFWDLSIVIAERDGADDVANVAVDGESVEGMRVRQRLGMRFLRTYRQLELIEGLQAHLLTNDCATRKLTLRLIREFDLAELVELELLGVAAEPRGDVSMTSEIVALLSSVESAATHDILWAALEHPNNRVRANAIESLSDRGDVVEADWEAVLRERAISDDNRIRANAVRALARLNPAEGERQLKLMLHDGRPMHRISGLWASARTGQVGCAHEVAALATNDELPVVRERAAQTASSLLGRLAALRIAEDRVVGVDVAAGDETRVPASRAVTALMGLVLVGGLARLTYAQAGDEEAGSRWSQISDAFVGGDGAAGGGLSWGAWLGWGMAAVLLILLVVVAFKVQLRDRAGFGADYRQFTKGLGVGLLDRWVVSWVAWLGGLQNGVGLLLSAGAFEHYVAKCGRGPVTLRKRFLQGVLRLRGEAIRQQLFG